MKVVTYNKLVRDNIPRIITEGGKQPIIETLSDGQYKASLDEKLAEELNEYLASKEAEELIDLLEVIYAIAATKGLSPLDLEELRIGKAQKRGAFTEKIFLKEVIEA